MPMPKALVATMICTAVELEVVLTLGRAPRR